MPPQDVREAGKRQTQANRRLFDFFERGARRARAGLPPAPEKQWSAAQVESYYRGFRCERGGG